MHPNNKLTVNAIEAYPIEDFSPEVSIMPFSRMQSCWSHTQMNHENQS